jgi:alcohol dehydrogenase
MRALLYDTALRLSTDTPQPDVPQGEALIRVLLAGICNTDLEITRGYMSGPSGLGHGVLGHEFVGVVEQAGDPSWVGQRVVGEINCACRTCSTCLRGDLPHCPNRTTLGIGGRDGCLADYCVLPLSNLHPVPPEVGDEQAVFAEPLAAALEITDRLHIRPTERVMVIGDGKLGLLVAQVLRLTGCALTVVGHHEDKLSILARQGVEVCREKDLAPDVSADVVVECSGQPGGFALARRNVRPRGRLALKSTFVGLNEISLTELVVDEVTLSGSRCGPFAPALRLLAQGLVDVQPLIEATYPLDEGLKAFEHARTRGSLKVLVKP